MMVAIIKLTEEQSGLLSRYIRENNFKEATAFVYSILPRQARTSLLLLKYILNIPGLFEAKTDNNEEDFFEFLHSVIRSRGNLSTFIEWYHESYPELVDEFSIRYIVSHVDSIESLEEYAQECVFWNNVNVIASLLRRLKAEEAIFFFSKAMTEALRSYNLEVIRCLAAQDSDHFFSLLSDENRLLYERLSALKSPKISSELMSQFANGFGQIQYRGALLVCAQIRSRKKDYDFNPVLIIGDSVVEFKELLYLIQDNYAKLSGQEIKFAISANHWVSGVMKIDKAGGIKVLFIDSLGKIDDVAPYILCINEILPNSRIYVTNLKRQYSTLGCSVFALDDLRHLYTIERYLPEAYKESGLFGYLACNSMNVYMDLSCYADEEDKFLDIGMAKLPLPLIRTQQSYRLFSEISACSEREQNLAVNKAGETPLVSVDNHFQYDQEKDKKINRRLEYKFQKMREDNLTYLEDHTDAEVEKEMQQFTLAAFKKRVCEPVVEVSLTAALGLFAPPAESASSEPQCQNNDCSSKNK